MSLVNEYITTTWTAEPTVKFRSQPNVFELCIFSRDTADTSFDSVKLSARSWIMTLLH